MKRLSLISAALLAASSLFAAKGPQVTNVEPPYWWVGMANDTLQVMLTGPDVAKADASVDYPGVKLVENISLDSPNYKFLYFTIAPSTTPGTMQIKLTANGKTTKVPYELKARDAKGEDYVGFDGGDVLYLLMPDRFAQSKEVASDHLAEGELRFPTKNDRSNLNRRHGGDIEGIRNHLPYLDSLGVTAIWLCPVLENDVPGGSYHGYATTNYYRVDPRYGTNDDYRAFIADAHKRGMKVVMDMIFNHSASTHPWMKDMPSKDWYNHPEMDVMTNHKLSTVYDPYVSDYDLDHAVNGWFVPGMPDLNQRNPYLMKYLIQNSIWWIESAKINGIRQDTYPYADMKAMATWNDALLKEYPNFNIVGECWYNNEPGCAFWQRGSKINPVDTKVPTVMDFAYVLRGKDMFNKDNGLAQVYDHLALDFLLADPTHILTFLDNHDTDRFLLEEPENLDKWKQAIAFLLTSRGIPQLYYGTEILMNGTKQHGDGHIRLDFPGGFNGDTVNAFTPEGRTDKQNEAWNYMSKILNWRRTQKDLMAKGSLKHFNPQNGLYVYQRSLGNKTVTVLLNGRDEEITVSMKPYMEVLPIGTLATDITTDQPVTITETMTFAPRQNVILQSW